ncbi:MAG: B12-binding domain-containing radical SAM protein [Chitinispirillia bacterium]|jgi:radical SAM superfamily enzyme YgiQ (UPF0313 family)
MPGILYLAAAIKTSQLTKDSYYVKTRHYNTTVQCFNEITEDIISNLPECIGFSCYCWNLPYYKKLARHIKNIIPTVKIIFGGPEISVKDEKECREFFRECPEADLIVLGEAEEKIPFLVNALCNQCYDRISDLSGYSFNPAAVNYSRIDTHEIIPLSHIPSIYPYSIDVKRSHTCGIHIVYECSRGCPNKCIYCQFIRWRNKQETFPCEKIKRELKWLLDQEVEGIHFADAVFDKDPEFAKKIISFVNTHNRRSTLLFYCSFADLTDELADLFEKTQCQIGVGVQSTNRDVLKILKRAHFKRFFGDSAKILKKRSVNFYIELMFGLPGDTIDSFKKSFEESLNIDPSFIMIFPLALIKGTPLGSNPESFNVIKYSEQEIRSLDLECDIKYLNLGLSQDFRLKDLELFDDVVLTCFYYYNRFQHCLRYLQKRWRYGSFNLYQTIGKKTKSFLKNTGQIPSNRGFTSEFKNEIRVIFKDILKMIHAGSEEKNAFKELYKIDFYRITVLHSPNREKIYLSLNSFHTLDKTPPLIESSDRIIKNAFGKIITINYTFEDLLNLHVLKNTIQKSSSIIYIYAPYNHADASIITLTEEQKFIIDLISYDHGLKYKSLTNSFRKFFRNTEYKKSISDGFLYSLLKELNKCNIIKILRR